MANLKTATIFGLLGVLVLTSTGAGTVFAGNKIDICHATDSVTNPYNKENVDPDSADGNTSNDNGKGDHSTHTGPVATSQSVAQALKDSHTAWGDIIPPHDNYVGLNWTTDGQALFKNNCNYVTITPTVTPSISSAPTATPSATATPTVTSTPTVSPTNVPTATATPTPSTSSGPTATPTPTPSTSSAPTATLTPTPSTSSAPTAGITPGVGGPGDGLSDGRSDGKSSTPAAVLGTSTLNDPYKGVLGANTMAKTGSFEQNLMNLLGVVGMSLLGAAYLSHKKKLA